MKTRGAPPFELDDFRYFMLGNERTDEQRSIVGDKLVAFATALVRSSCMTSIRQQFYGAAAADPADFVNPGEFRPKAFSYWVSLGPKASRPNCHFTVRIAEDGIAVEAFSPFKSWTSALIDRMSRKPGEFVRDRCVRSGRRQIRNHFRLREAYYCDPDSSYKGQCISDRVDYLTVHPSVLNETNVLNLIIEPTRARLNERAFRPEIFFVRHFPLSQVMNRGDLVDEVAAAFGPMLPYFAFAFEST